LGLILAVTLIACAAKQKNILETSESQVKLRSMQSRVFDTADRDRLLRTIIATLQDLGFVIDDADKDLGTVSGTKRSGYSLRMTVSIRPRGAQQTIVRSNAQYNLMMVEDPEPYQQFFSSLSKALFIEAHLVGSKSAGGGGGTKVKPVPKKTDSPKATPKLTATPETAPTAKAAHPPQEKPKLAATPKEAPVVRVGLRRQPIYISNQMQITDMLLDYDFFDRSRNPRGSFVNSFVDNNDGTVTDKATGLMWEKSGSSRLYNGRAKEYIKQLNKQRFAGYSGWRMPTVEELASLLVRKRTNGAHMDPVFDRKQTLCWTIDKCESQSWSWYKGAWLVDFKNGEVNEAYWTGSGSGQYSKNTENYVKAVRSDR
jgi:hypothetical protein